MNPAAKERPEKPLLATGVIVVLAGAAVSVGVLDVVAVAEATEPLADAEAVCACLVELSIWQFPALQT